MSEELIKLSLLNIFSHQWKWIIIMIQFHFWVLPIIIFTLTYVT